MSLFKNTLSEALEVADLCRMAKAYTPRMFFQYADSGSFSQQSYRDNETDFKKIKLHQRVFDSDLGNDISKRDTTSTFLGENYSMPIFFAPVGMLGMQRANGEILVAKAAKQLNLPFILSNMSICSMEDVYEATNGYRFFYQLYMMKDKEYMKNQIERAKKINVKGLILTVDLPILGQRYADIRNSLKAPPPINLQTILQFASRPRWCIDMLSAKRWHFGNIKGYVKNAENLENLAQWTASQFVQNLSTRDLEWIRSLYDGPLIVKGILHPEDALLCYDLVDAMIISNHGGRQLDCAKSSISMLTKILNSLKEKKDYGTKKKGKIVIDGGIRCGQDIIKALAMGADMVMLGRPMVYGLGAGGESGIERLIQILKTEMDISMTLMRVGDVNDLCHKHLASVPEDFF